MTLQRVRRMRSTESTSAPDSGFTLIEMLIVVIILGILAAIVVFSVGDSTTKAGNAACKTNVGEVDQASAAYLISTGTQAATIGDLVTGGFLHGDSHFTTSSGATVTVESPNGNYTIVFSPGTGSQPGDADTTSCP